MNRILVLQQGRDVVADWTTGALFAERRGVARQLEQELSLQRVAQLEQLVEAARQHPAEIVFLVTRWTEPAEKLIEVTQELRQFVPKLVYLDTFDPSSSPYFGILPHVDLYVKKQLLKDRSQYTRPVKGGYVFADYHARNGLDIGDWHFGSVADPDQISKLALGWNLGTAPHLRKALRRSSLRPVKAWERRPIQVQYRVSLSGQDQGDWYTHHRRGVHDRLNGSFPDLETVVIASPAKGLSIRQFRRELRHSRVVVSPYGYGEVTDRDFETVIQGALLVKPDMSHLETAPDLYRDQETCVAVDWSLDNLVERCQDILSRPREGAEMAARARAEYREWFQKGGVVACVRSILERLSA